MSKLAVILLLHINGLVNFFISFDLSIDNATKFCNEDGTWDKTAYDNCLNTVSHPVPTHDVEYNTYIYCIGYLLSIVVLSIAVIIFVTFKWVSFFISTPYTASNPKVYREHVRYHFHLKEHETRSWKVSSLRVKQESFLFIILD